VVTETRWLVAAVDVPTSPGLARWLLGWLRPGHRHVLAYRETYGGLLIVQTTVARLQVDWFPGVTEADYTAELEAGGATVREMARSVDDGQWVIRGLTCVSIVRALAGLPGRWQTPAQLMRAISRTRE